MMLFTWEVMGPSFIEKESLTRRAAASDRSLHKWIDHMDEKQREHLIGELFSVLEATGADTISQIHEEGRQKSRCHGVTDWINSIGSKSYGAGTDHRTFWQLAGITSSAGT